MYKGVFESFQTESIMKQGTTTINTHWEATQRVMAAKLTKLTHKIVIQLHLMAESCTICSYHSRWPVRKVLDTPSYYSVNKISEKYHTRLCFIAFFTGLFPQQQILPDSSSSTRNLTLITIINADGIYLATYAALLLNLKLIKQGYYQEQHVKPVPMTEVSINWVTSLL
jgi:hypothetical protein